LVKPHLGRMIMSNHNDFYVVGIGASAGGLEAVQRFFDHIPDNTGVAYVIIQHLSPDFKSLMPELLAKHTGMHIYTAKNNQKIKPNCVYLNNRTTNIGIKDYKFILFDKAPKDHLNLPIDILFHMLGESYKDKSIGVILSGTGSDGSRGIKTIKEAGGTILVQDPETAQFDGMPNSAISTNLADFILSPGMLAEKIVQFTGKNLQLESSGDLISSNEKVFNAILEEIHRHTGVNFKKYKTNTLLRRLEKRLSLHNIESLQEYLKLLKTSEKEKSAIKQEFLIGVTSFFRDTEAFKILKTKVIPEICEKKRNKSDVRIWIPGCSSGEEVYSIALLFDNYIRNNKSGIDFKIFATDIDKKALQQASMGSYPVNTFLEIEKPYLQEYFLKTGDRIQIIKRIREKIVFSYHDLTNDPPFIKVDLISCRNLLIYLNNSTQKAILSGFQFALNKDGFLFLGSSESLGSVSKSFRDVDSKYKIFQNLYENTRLVRNDDKETYLYKNKHIPEQPLTTYAKNSQAGRKQSELFYYKYLSQKHAPVTVFIDKSFTVNFMLGEFKHWFRQVDGTFTNNLLDMVGLELSTIIRNGVRRLEQSDKPITIKNLTYTVNEETTATDLYFEKVEHKDTHDQVYMIQFGFSKQENSSEEIVLSNDDISNFSKERIEDLEYELKENRSELQNVVEELETSNEELQSSNEELMSSNEELQISNEELQSVNEELYTVNTEFQEKNKELEDLNNDILNLLNSTDIGTLFLDTDLNIRKFTPAIKHLFNLQESDIGRSISSFASEFDDDTRKSLINDSKTALENLQTSEKEIRDGEGNWYLKRILPFITAEKRIEGVVITFVNITSLKKAEKDLGESEIRLSEALSAGNMAWWELRLPDGFVSYSKNKTDLLGRRKEDFTSYKDFMKIVHPDDHEAAMNAMRQHIDGEEPLYKCEYRMQHANGNYLWFQDIGQIIAKNNDRITVTGIVTEITEKKHTDSLLLKAKKKAEAANIYKNQFLANMSHEIRTPMNGLVGFAALLRDSKLNAKERNKYIDIIESSSRQLLNLINDIIDVSKIEAGELQLREKPCRLDLIFTELYETFNKLKEKKGKDQIDIILNIPKKHQKVTILSDPERIKQILTNLLSNALKFTHKGKIEFGYNINNDKIIIQVSDTGIGIDGKDISNIFKRFQRTDQTNEEKYDGTGLGLAITKGIIDNFNGTINVESQHGKGSLFTIEIPFIPAKIDQHNKISSTKPDWELLKGKELLIAEDDYVNNLFLEELFKNIPLKTYWARNGIEAINIYKDHPDIELVLMDIRMPILDGYKAAQEILKINPKAKIIAQTAHAMSSDRDKCLNNGFAEYIAKPIQKDQFMGLITNLIIDA